MRNSLDQLFLTHLAVIVSYPTGAGGKFITNCLSFHPRFHPQSNVFLKDIESRISHIFSSLDDYDGKEWNDLGMGCQQFFNVSSLRPDIFNHHDVLNHRSEIKEASIKLLLPVISYGFYFFKTAHSITQEKFYSAIWPNSKKIVMDNCSTFINKRNNQVKGEWKVVDTIKLDDNDDAFVFDANCLLDWTGFKDEYKRLLAWFDEVPTDLDRLEIFYRKYMAAVILP
jgi:hypothetical protein